MRRDRSITMAWMLSVVLCTMLGSHVGAQTTITQTFNDVYPTPIPPTDQGHEWVCNGGASCVNYNFDGISFNSGAAGPMYVKPVTAGYGYGLIREPLMDFDGVFTVGVRAGASNFSGGVVYRVGRAPEGSESAQGYRVLLKRLNGQDTLQLWAGKYVLDECDLTGSFSSQELLTVIAVGDFHAAFIGGCGVTAINQAFSAPGYLGFEAGRLINPERLVVYDLAVQHFNEPSFQNPWGELFDDFNRASSSELGTAWPADPWSEVPSGVNDVHVWGDGANAVLDTTASQPAVDVVASPSLAQHRDFVATVRLNAQPNTGTSGYVGVSWRKGTPTGTLATQGQGTHLGWNDAGLTLMEGGGAILGTDGAASDGAPHELRIEVSGGRVEAYRDGRIALEYQDPDCEGNGTCDSGYLGLFAREGTGEVDFFAVEPIEVPTVAPSPNSATTRYPFGAYSIDAPSLPGLRERGMNIFGWYAGIDKESAHLLDASVSGVAGFMRMSPAPRGNCNVVDPRVHTSADITANILKLNPHPSAAWWSYPEEAEPYCLGSSMWQPGGWSWDEIETIHTLLGNTPKPTFMYIGNNRSVHAYPVVPGDYTTLLPNNQLEAIDIIGASSYTAGVSSGNPRMFPRCRIMGIRHAIESDCVNGVCRQVGEDFAAGDRYPVSVLAGRVQNSTLGSFAPSPGIPHEIQTFHDTFSAIVGGSLGTLVYYEVSFDKNTATVAGYLDAADVLDNTFTSGQTFGEVVVRGALSSTSPEDTYYVGLEVDGGEELVACPSVHGVNPSYIQGHYYDDNPTVPIVAHRAWTSSGKRLVIVVNDHETDTFDITLSDPELLPSATIQEEIQGVSVSNNGLGSWDWSLPPLGVAIFTYSL